MEDNNYLFFDGSSMIAQIRTLWRINKWASRKLDPLRLVASLASNNSRSLGAFVSHGASFLSYKRAVFYFANGDSQIDKFLYIPDIRSLGLVKDVNFKFCGRKIAGSSRYDEWVETVPEEHRDRVSRSEKGVDIQICCDALQLAANRLTDRLFLLTNDSDFIPLCETLKQFGANISLMLLPERSVNSELVAACDSYYQVSEETVDFALMQQS